MAKQKEPEVNQPSLEEQREYQSLRDNDPSIVFVRNKKFLIHWAKKGQLVKLGRLLTRKGKTDNPKKEETENLEDGVSIDAILKQVADDSKLSCKASAIYLLNGFWALKFNYWWLWRWFYYIRQYSDDELKDLLFEGKKKLPLRGFLEVTISLTEAKDTVMMMRTQEAERILRELNSGQPTQSQKE